MISHFLIGWTNISTSQHLSDDMDMDTNTKFDIFYDQISQFRKKRKLSKREIKLSTKPLVTKHILAKYDIDINSIPKSLGINIQIQI